MKNISTKNISTKNLNINEFMFESQYSEFLKYTEDIDRIDEFALPRFVQRKIDFIKDMTQTLGASFKEMIAFFRDKRVFKIFSTISWSFLKLWKLLKAGYKAYNDILKIIPNYVHSTGVGKWTEEKLRGLDNYLQNHPKVKKLAGFAVAGILIYIWLNMSFTGNLAYDMSFDDVVLALSGSFSLSKLFAGPDGLKMLMLFATGVLGVSFPWPGAQSVQLISGFTVSVAKLVHKRVKTIKPL